MITAMVRQLLANTSAVSNLVSTRIYVWQLPDPVTLPAVVVLCVGVPLPDPDVSKGWTARVQMSAVSNPVRSAGMVPTAEVESIAAVLSSTLHKTSLNKTPDRWTIGSVSFDVTDRKIAGGQGLFESPNGWLIYPVDVLIKYTEV